MASQLGPLVLPTPPPTGNFNAIDPLDSRYYDAEFARYLSEESRIAYQAHVEAALGHNLADFGLCTTKVASQIEIAAHKVTAKNVFLEEKHTKHDIKALVNCIKSRLKPDAAAYVHFGATSYDIVATAAALQLRDFTNAVALPRLIELEKTLINLAEIYADTTQIGRTHGQHAVPITFGFALGEYVSRLGESILRIQSEARSLKGKFSGAVGAYNALSLFVDDPQLFEKQLLAKLGLEPAPYSNQIIPGENTSRLLDELVTAAAIMSNLAHDMRHLQRSEIAEVREKFEPEQTGSSTMAHKRNPINFENVASLYKQVLAQTINLKLNLISEHQRDLTDSASTRFYTIILASVSSMAKRLNTSMANLEVDKSNLERNLISSGGAIAAEPLYLLLAKYGHLIAHEKAKEMAHTSLDKDLDLVSVIKSDEEAAAYWQKFSQTEKDIIKAPEKHYIGLSVKKTESLIKKWRQQFS